MHDGPELDVQLDRRALLSRGLAFAVGAVPCVSFLAGCGDDDAMMGRRMPEWMMSEGMMDPAMIEDMRVIRQLLAGHERISRSVDDVPGGIRSRTTSTDEQLADLIRTHVWQMKSRVEEGAPIRRMDPVFREIFIHHEAIEMEVERLPRGVRVMETSTDPEVELLIRQHARRAVSEFVAEGTARAMQPTPLPAGYREG